MGSPDCGFVVGWLAADGSVREILELTIRACMSAEPEEIFLLSNLILQLAQAVRVFRGL
jgi:hypothetical protein